jgi:hypothetical protein
MHAAKRSASDHFTGVIVAAWIRIAVIVISSLLQEITTDLSVPQLKCSAVQVNSHGFCI